MKHCLILFLSVGILSSCVSSKKYKTLQEKYNSSEMAKKANADALGRMQGDLSDCNSQKARLTSDLEEARKINAQFLASMGEMAMLTRKEAENLTLSLEKLKEKDMRIKTLNHAVNRKESMTIALVTTLKRAVGQDDKDIEINVEKGVVMVSISDKFLFTTGSYNVSPNANEVLRKVALILQDRPDFDVLVEGHTDDIPYKKGDLIDNWDLSVKRATALVRVLYTKFNIAPGRLIPAGRAQYVPLVPNDSAENRAKNRRTRIIIMPKIDQFYGMIEQGMKEAAKKK